MKTKEFIKRVEGMGYKVEVVYNAMFIRDCEGGFQGMSYFKLENHIHIDTPDLNLAKLCIEYAETPLAEREEEKRYTVKLPDSHEILNMHALRKIGERVRICKTNRTELVSNKTYRLTEAEIKRNHEYLWQFAKEVTE